MPSHRSRASVVSRAGEPQVALFRGMNLAGRNRVAMADLVTAFAELGCAEVRHYIQSGNVVFCAPRELTTRLPQLLVGILEERFGLRGAVTLRTAAELDEVCRKNPFLASGMPAAALHVAFLTGRPSPARIRALDPNRSPGDAFIVRGREIYLSLPHGVARTKLSNGYFDSKLGVASTVRNWRTVLTLLAMMTA